METEKWKCAKGSERLWEMDEILKREENNILNLRQLYGHYGYVHYKMNKFEEYDLYVANKDFLVHNDIITFTDKDWH